MIDSMLSNRSMPPSIVIPELAYPDIGGAIDWLCKAFGFTLRIRIADPCQAERWKDHSRTNGLSLRRTTI